MLNRLHHLRIPTSIALSFISVIFIGSLLLSLPFVQTPGSDSTYIDHLFISVSATCVTGLFTESIADSYNIFGKIILLAMIQIGGLGLMTLYGLFMIFLHKNIPYRQKQAMTSAVNYDSIGSSTSFIRRIVQYTLIIEAAGALILSFHFIPEKGLLDGLGTSIFLAVSAFCNAGFDPFGNISLIPYAGNQLINLTIAALIILGGIGFGIWFDISQSIRNIKNSKTQQLRSPKALWKKLRPHTKLALIMTLALILGGFFLTLMTEWNNQNTFAGQDLSNRLLQAFFQSVTLRTAGFATMDYTQAEPVTLLIWSGLMFIGGSPGGAAGGLKTTTVAVILLFIRQIVTNKQYIHFDKHNIPSRTIRMALVVGALYTSLLLTSTLILQWLEPQTELILLVFEAVSAMATVGVSASLTPTLSVASLIYIMFLMFVGRIGPLTLVTALPFESAGSREADIKYADTNILIG